MLCFVGWVRGRIGELLPCKVFDFLAHNGDTALVRGIEFEDTGVKELGTEEGFGES